MIIHPLCVLTALCGFKLFSPFGNKNLTFFKSSADEEKRMPEEEAESAEVLF
jgi:hypothetical protein